MQDRAPRIPRHRIFGGWGTLAILLIVSFAMRAVLFGDPLIHVDETFYNLVGERMLQGAVPYVDIWDRKPIGLFLIYAGAHWAMGSGVIGYQLLAALSAALTAFVISRMARTLSDARGAVLAGIAYLLGLAVFRCLGGQSPVFYNLVMACAASILLALLCSPFPRHIVVRGAVVMLLVGIALQIKYTVVFEGIAMGVTLLVLYWRCHRQIIPLVAAGALWIVCALVPTMLALGWYAHIGHAYDFVWANFLSIFERDTGAALSWDRITDLATDFALTLPFWGTAIILLRKRKDAHFLTVAPHPEAWGWLLGWAGAALAGFLIFGTYYDHYTAALLPPFSILIAPALGWETGKRRVTALVFTFLIVAATAVTFANVRQFGDRADLAQAAGLINRELHGRCLYVFEGNAALYSATHACLASRFAFPQHISGATDSVALGIDSRAALQRILQRYPGVIVTGEQAVSPRPNMSVRPMMAAALRQDYQLYAHAHLGHLKLRLYRLRPEINRQQATRQTAP